MSSSSADIFGPGSNFSGRLIRDYSELTRRVENLRALGKKIVLTSGTFDISHIGHGRYLEQGRELGDVLIVGVDSDDRVKRRKGPHRPIVPEDERLEFLCHFRHVDLVVLKGADDPLRHLIKTVRPDFLLISQSTRERDEEEIAELEKLCGKVVNLEPQATTSTTAKIRRLLIDFGARALDEYDAITRRIKEQVSDGLTDGREILAKILGGDDV